MSGYRLSLLAGLLLAGPQAQATTIAVAEPGMLSLLGLGAVIAVLATRYFRR